MGWMFTLAGNRKKYCGLLASSLFLVASLSSYQTVSANEDIQQVTIPNNEFKAEQSKPLASRSPTNTAKTLDWIDLLPDTADQVALMEHYADLVIQRLDPPDDPDLQTKIIAEFNQAPANTSLDGMKIRLAGYMLVLDDRDGRITEFLLVPYSGAGVHQPAPPANQMILVRVQPERALKADQAYESVWIAGRLKVQKNTTSVAQVAYLLEDANVSLYTAEDAKQAEDQHLDEAAMHEHEHTEE